MLKIVVSCFCLLLTTSSVATSNDEPFVVGLFQEEPFRDQVSFYENRRFSTSLIIETNLKDFLISFETARHLMLKVLL